MDDVERHRMEDALREAEQKYAAIFEKSPVAIALTKMPEAVTVAVNDAFLRLFEFTREEVVGQTSVNLGIADPRSHDAIREELAASGAVHDFQCVRATKGGERRFLSLNIDSVSIDGQKHVITIVQDVTKRREAEETVRAHSEWLELAQEAAGVGTFDWDIQTYKLRWSRELEALYGLQADRFDGTLDGWIQRIHPDDQELVLRSLLRSAAGGDDFEHDFRVAWPDGSIHWLHGRGKVLCDAQGAPERMIGVNAHVSARKEAETLSAILAISSDAIIFLDDDQRITMFNNGAENIFGYSKAEAIGSTLDMLIPERFRTIHHHHLARFAAGPATSRRMGERSVSIFGLRKNGEEFPADAAISKVAVGRKSVLTVALRDITERRRAENEQRILAKAGQSLINAGYDYERLLTDIAELLVWEIADICLVEIAREGRTLRRKVVSADPARAATCSALERYQVDRARPHLGFDVWTSRRPVVVSDVTTEYIQSLAQSPEHFDVLRALELTSLIAVPIVARDQFLGLLALGSSRSSRRYGTSDLRLLEGLASRIGPAVDNSLLQEALANALRSPLEAIAQHARALRGVAQRGSAESESLDAIDRAAKAMHRLIDDATKDTRRTHRGE
jgi:PAS domain S-box-containing protein